MTNIVSVQYAQTGASVASDAMGMREMQRRVYMKAAERYILLKAPPASGKSRALMYVALEKLRLGLVKKVIISVPERSIAKSFESVALTANGFHTDWVVKPENDLCRSLGDSRKSQSFQRFMESEDKVLLCTHSTLRFSFEKVQLSSFNDCLLAIDEFHHVSADVESKLGELLRSVISGTSASVLAMTGSYFRGDSLPILLPADEAKFTKVTYNYYEQLNGYRYLKSLGIGFHFYKGKYLDAISEVLDTEKKTIIHIPSVNSYESLKEKMMEVDMIIDAIGDWQSTEESGIHLVKSRKNGRIIRVADLVNDEPSEREEVVKYLRNVKLAEEVDIIIALGMAKEGFDWPFCETALTVGYRGSLTEIIQIIGRCTRDCEGKTHAQFTNLISEPDAEREEVMTSVNNMLKAIAASLLMEEVMAPRYDFASAGDDNPSAGPQIRKKGYKEPSTPRVREIIKNDLPDLKARILQDPGVQAAFPGGIAPSVINGGLIPKVIREIYPTLTPSETESLRDYLIVTSVVSPSSVVSEGGNRFVRLGERLVDVNDLDMDLICSVNPFQQAYEVMSRSLSPRVLKAVQECIRVMKISMTDDEAQILWPKINEFFAAKRREPDLDSLDPVEKRLAEALLYLRRAVRGG